ncbi:MAG: hypothetical protein LBS05_00705 [Tannerellaceae bacterium]|jgi:hypothetical protein|nr:hypothetical protein [Tannerellaceae bacterium]
MRSYLTEILITVASLTVMSLVMVAYFKAVKEEKAYSSPDALYTIVPPNARTLLAINRPYLFNEMILSHQALRPVFVAAIPDIFFSLLNTERQTYPVLFSFHPQGVVCYVQGGSRTAAWITNELLPERFRYYPPQKQTADGIDFYYYPDTENRYFGYYVHNGIWVGSYSSKLLERAAVQQLQGEILLPEAMNNLRETFDTQAPLNLICPAGELGIDAVRWLPADLFVSEGSICCHTHLPYAAAGNAAAFGDTLSRRIEDKYPSLRIRFQIDHEEETVYYTGCIPN